MEVPAHPLPHPILLRFHLELPCASLKWRLLSTSVSPLELCPSEMATILSATLAPPVSPCPQHSPPHSPLRVRLESLVPGEKMALRGQKDALGLRETLDPLGSWARR